MMGRLHGAAPGSFEGRSVNEERGEVAQRRIPSAGGELVGLALEGRPERRDVPPLAPRGVEERGEVV